MDLCCEVLGPRCNFDKVSLNLFVIAFKQATDATKDDTGDVDQGEKIPECHLWA